jgi:hypothetical protein
VIFTATSGSEHLGVCVALLNLVIAISFHKHHPQCFLNITPQKRIKSQTSRA